MRRLAKRTTGMAVLLATAAAACMAAAMASGPATRPATSTVPAGSQPATQSRPATSPAEAPGPPLQVPDPASFRAFDRPSDDGSTIGVEWGRSPSERKGVYYILEIALTKDFQPGKYREIRIPSLGSLKSEHPEYFGFSPALRNVHYAGVRPVKYFPPGAPKPAPPPPATAPAASQPAAATAPMASSQPAPASAPTTAPQTQAASGPAAPTKPPQEEAEKQLSPWELGRLEYEAKKRNKLLQAERREIDARVYYFRLAVSDGRQKVYVQQDGRPKVISGQARANYFKFFKLNNLIFSIAFGCVVLAFIRAARHNPNLFIRKIAGLDAVEEAIGRATEMGRSAFFVHGLDGMGSLSTIAAVNILGRVARRAAEYDTRVRVMNNDPIVMAVSQEVVQQACTEAGRPDAYNADDVSLVAPDQFSYVAAVGGLMVRERPAAIFLMGYFYAESLLLAETGAATGAIQIAGTDSYTQLPFFVTTCDYTLMGEELYAASAYLSREPKLLGSLRGQDVGKAFLMVVFVIGTLLATVGLPWVAELFRAF